MNRTLARVLGRSVPLRSEQEVTDALRLVAEYLVGRPEIGGWRVPVEDGERALHFLVSYEDHDDLHDLDHGDCRACARRRECPVETLRPLFRGGTA